MRASTSLTKGEPIDEAAVWLVLAGALVWWEENHSTQSRWGWPDWERFLHPLDPREACVIVLHVVRGWTLERIGEWLGVSRGMAHELWIRGKGRLAESMSAGR